MDQLFDKLPYEKLEGINPLHIFAGAAGVGVLLFVIGYFTLIGAVREEYAGLEGKKTEVEQTLKKYRATVGQKDQIFRNFVQVSGKLSGLKRQLPKREEVLRFLRKATLAGKALDVEMMSFEIENGTTKDYYIEIPVIMQFRGGLWNTMDFFEAMQNMLSLVDFANLRMSVENVELYEMGGSKTIVDKVSMLHTSIVAKAYVYVDGAEDQAVQK